MASSEIRTRCPYSKGVVIWYDNCTVKYSNEFFFGKIDYSHQVYLNNVNNVNDPNMAVVAWMKLFATAELELGGYSDEKFYGLVQCSRDLSSSNWKKCLDDAVSKLQSSCDGKRGGRILGGSCNIRYELSPFVNA
ncbi:hypothetical protein MKW98_016096 [Papaver atlanticum]|uniref:Gnk2-homologous domain-containing protein n=1 Tax=Papaver atlanticum TaxID=357466 RepID=A0AAD4T5P1_9MAGN|nr:hypothetical protein MKW98_016096 [Papaver atlanticum]